MFQPHITDYNHVCTILKRLALPRLTRLCLQFCGGCGASVNAPIQQVVQAQPVMQAQMVQAQMAQPQMMQAQVAPQMAYQQQPQMMAPGVAPMQQQQFMQPAGPMPQLDGMFDCFNDMETCMCVTVGCTCCLAGQ